MNAIAIEPSFDIRLDGDRRAYLPGETLAGEYRLVGASPADVRSVELSVLWYTEGAGDEELVVHFFERQGPDNEGRLDASRPRRFSTVLPNTPQSYEGLLVKIHWCVRARAFLRQGKDVLAEQAFLLGRVPPAIAVETP